MAMDQGMTLPTQSDNLETDWSVRISGSEFTVSDMLRLQIERAGRMVTSGRYATFEEAFHAVEMGRLDPTGDFGIYGLGRCAGCGESFRSGQDQAEIAAGLVHAECVGEEALA